MKAPKAIVLTKLKQWYIPANIDSYKALRGLKIPLIRFHKDFLPTLQLITDKHKVEIEEVSFKHEVLVPFLDKIGKQWLKKDNRKCVIGPSIMKFDAITPDSFDEAKASIPKLQEILESFFKRWGYKITFDLSQTKNRIRLTVQYWYDSSALPVIPIAENPEELPKIKLTLGFTRIVFSLGEKYVDTVVEIAQGGLFKPLHASRCLYSQISTVQPMLIALCDIVNRQPTNLDNIMD